MQRRVSPIVAPLHEIACILLSSCPFLSHAGHPRAIQCNQILATPATRRSGVPVADAFER